MGGAWTDIEERQVVRWRDGNLYAPPAEDVGNYLRATASYTDGHSDGESEDKTANKVSDNPVLADTSNKSARFPRPGALTRMRTSRTRASREVAENSAARRSRGRPG